VKALDKKLMRDLRHLAGQLVTIALVVGCGIASYVAIHGTQRALLRARDGYFERQRFADVFAHVERAPEALRERIAAIDGVASVHTRLVEAVSLPVPGMHDPPSGQLVSLPATGEAPLGGILLREGRMFAPGHADEAVVLEAFAKAHGFRLDDRLPAVLAGVRRELRIVGVAIAPEWVFAVAPGEMMPDPRRFAVLWMDRAALAAAFQKEGAFDDLLVRLQPGASERAVIGSLDRLLTPYGSRGAYGRDRQPSAQVLRGELAQLRTLSGLMPAIFLGVAAFLINLVLTRLVQVQRSQIASLRAVGYTRGEVGRHYLALVLVVVTLGAVLGVAVGAWLGAAMTDIYLQYFTLPDLRFRIDMRVFVLAAGTTLVAGVVGAIGAVLDVMRLPPAEAMRPEAPAVYRRGLGLPAVVRRVLGPSPRMIVREITRRPLRAFASTLAVAMSVALLVSGRFGFDAVDWFMEVQFGLAQRENLTVTFRRPVPTRALGELRHLPGVLEVEGLRTVAVRFRKGQRARDSVITGHPPDARLRHVVDLDGRRFDPPPDGVLVSATLGRVLGLRKGEALDVELLEGRRGRHEVRVTGFVEDLAGLPGAMRADALARLAGDEGRVSQALLRVDASEREALSRALAARPEVLGVSRRDTAIDLFRKQTAGQMRTNTLILTAFAAVIAIGVIYNAARIALATRARDLASLRVLGFRRGEISAILLGELGVLVALALVPGMLLGHALAVGMMSGVDPELWRFPVIVSARTYAFATLVTLGASLASALLVRRRLDTLDLIGVLKSRE
jgi:putative ABC transport system permease protein